MTKKVWLDFSNQVLEIDNSFSIKKLKNLSKKYDLFNYIRTFPTEKLHNINIPKDCVGFLEKIGLPEWAAPHLNFGYFEEEEWLPKLNDWSWKKVEPPINITSYVIGTDENEDPICILEKGIICLFEQIDDYKQIFINNCIYSLLKTLLVYQKMINDSINYAKNSEIKNVSKELIEECYRIISIIDSNALKKGTFWQKKFDYLLREISIS